MGDRTAGAVTEPHGRASHTLLALIGLGILNHTVLAGSRVTVSLYALSQGASPLLVGALMGLYSFLPMLLAIGAGRLSDRIGVRRPMVVGSCGVAIGAVLPWLVPGIAVLFATTALIGMAFMLYQVAAHVAHERDRSAKSQRAQLQEVEDDLPQRIGRHGL